jgi:hypothetical protein
MHSFTTQARLLLGALLTVGLLTAGTTSAVAKPDADITREIVPGTSEYSKVAASNYGCNTAAQDLRCYGAIYYSPHNGAWGLSTDYKSATYANRRAYKECAKHSGSCRRVVTVRNACAALAVRYWSDGSVRNYAGGWDRRDKWTAARKAKANAGAGSRTRTYLCTTRYR